MKIYLRFLGVMITLLMGLSVANAAPRQQDNNLLDNPSFERPFPNGVAEDWQKWFRNDPVDTKDPDCLNGYHFRPKWGDETSSTDLIHEGFASQYVGNNWDTWQAGVFQTVSVTPGTAYRFSFFARVHGSNQTNTASEGDLQANVRAGIDPNGSEKWNDADVVWSSSGSPHDSWQQFSIEAVATDTQLTVFAGANWGIEGVNQCRQFLDTWFDSAILSEVLPPATDTPVPLPTLPPAPTAINPPLATATSEIPPTAAPEPTATAVPTDTPIPGATICVNAFADANANGLRDESESYIAGITFRVGNLDQLIGQAVSLGTTEAVCFAGIVPGSYQVSQLVPANLQMTTAPNATLNVEEGKTYGVEFGSRIPPVGISNNDTSSPDTIASNSTLPTVAPGIVNAPNSAGVNWLLVGGIFVAVVAIFGLIAFFLLVLRRQPGE